MHAFLNYCDMNESLNTLYAYYRLFSHPGCLFQRRVYYLID